MQHIVSLSGGLSSAVAADRVIERYGRDSVLLWFADTGWEDEDLYRFLSKLQTRWGVRLHTYRDGRTPLDVAEEHHVIPNHRVAACSRELKIAPFRKFLKARPKPVTVHLGLDWTEVHRMEAPKANYERIEGVTVDYPLMWQPYEYRPYSEVVESWGIAIPRLYRMGFPHNNCGGRCVKQGLREWVRLAVHLPERFAEVEKWESDQRAKDERRSRFALLQDRTGGVRRPIPLSEVRQRAAEAELSQPHLPDDAFACFCSY